MPSPSTLGGILNEIALARIGFAQEGDVIRQKLWSAVAEGPQDAPSVTKRVEGVLGQYKITPSLAQKLYLSEVEANRGSGTAPVGDAEQAIETRNKTILRHTLRNIASPSNAPLRTKIEGALLANDLGYEINALQDTGKAPGFDWSETPKNRPLIDLMVKAEQANPALFSRAVSAAATSISTGSNNQRAELARLLDEDGHPMTAAIVRFVIGTGLPSKTAVAGDLPEDLRYYLTIMYAEALAAGQVEAFNQFLQRQAIALQAAGVDMKANQQAALAEFRNTVARGRGDFAQSPAPKVGLPVTGNERLDSAVGDFAKTWTELMEDAKRNNKEASAKLALSAWLQRAKGFAKPVQAVAPQPPQQQPQQVQAPEEFLNNFYRGLVDPDEIEREKNQFFLQKDRIGQMSDDDPSKAKAIRGLAVLQERLLRLLALQEALAGRGATADNRERMALTAINDNRQAITAARQAGQSTVILKDPTQYETVNGVVVFQSVPKKLPPPAAPVPVVPAAQPQPPAGQSAADKIKEAVDKTAARGQESVASLRDKLNAWAPELASIENEQNKLAVRTKQLKLGYGMLQAVKIGAASHGQLQTITFDLRKAVSAEQRSSDDPTSLAMDSNLKKNDLDAALKAMGSKVAAADILNLKQTVKKGEKAALVKGLPSDAAIASFIANTPIQLGKPSKDVGFNATELYYVVSIIRSVKFLTTEPESGGAMTDQLKSRMQGTAPKGELPSEDATDEIENALFGGRVSPLQSQIMQHLDLGVGSLEELDAAAERLLTANVGALLPANVHPVTEIGDTKPEGVIDADSAIVGVCGYDNDGVQYCVDLHVRLAGVTGAEARETKDNRGARATGTFTNILLGMKKLRLMLNPRDTGEGPGSAKYSRWAGVLFGEDKNGKLVDINVDLQKALDAAGLAGKRYAQDYGYESPPASVIEESLRGGSADDDFGGRVTQVPTTTRPAAVGNPEYWEMIKNDKAQAAALDAQYKTRVHPTGRRIVPNLPPGVTVGNPPERGGP